MCRNKDFRTVSFVVAFENGVTSTRVALGQTLPRCLSLHLTEYYYSTSAGAAQSPLVVNFGDAAFPQAETNSKNKRGFIVATSFPEHHVVYGDNGRTVSDTPKSGINSFNVSITALDGGAVSYDTLVLYFTAWVLDAQWEGSEVITDRGLLERLARPAERTDRAFDKDLKGKTIPGMVSTLKRHRAKGK